MTAAVRPPMEDGYQQDWVRAHDGRPAAVTGAREACGGCGGGRLAPFLDLGSTPLADRFPASPGDPERWHPLGAAVCEDCWLAQLTHLVPDGELFGDGYGFCTGSSPSAVTYFGRYARWALDLFGAQAERLTVEIACNDGTLLKHFRAAGCPVLGVDPAQPAASMAQEAGLEVWAEPFTWDVAERIRDERGPAGLVIANNVMAHVADPWNFLSGVRKLITPGGIALIEFQYLPRLLAGGQFDHVYHEHRAFFTVDSFLRVAAGSGLGVIAAEHVAAQGGSLRMICGYSEPSPALERDRAGEGWLRCMAAYSGVQGRAEFTRRELLSVLQALRREGKTVAGWAAPAKSGTLLNFCGITPDLVSHVVDVTPGKIGRYTPGTHLPVTGPGERPEPDVYLLLAWNYLPGVIRREREFLDRGGKILVPVPVPVML